jgi:surfactin synthase thioesterase subunit
LAAQPAGAIETMADDTAALMRKLGDREYCVLGFSMGPLVAQEVVPQRVAQVVTTFLAVNGYGE